MKQLFAISIIFLTFACSNENTIPNTKAFTMGWATGAKRCLESNGFNDSTAAEYLHKDTAAFQKALKQIK